MAFLSNEVAQDLLLLNSLRSEEVKEFCQMAIQIVKQQPPPQAEADGSWCARATTLLPAKRLSKAAAKLGLDDAIRIDKCIGALAYVYLNAAKFKTSADSLALSLQGLSIEQHQQVAEVLSLNYDDLRAVVQRAKTDFLKAGTQYKQLHWRLDAILATRAKLKQQPSPLITLDLLLQSLPERSVKSHLLQTDPVTLVQIVEQLETALDQIRSTRVRQVKKYLLS